MKKKLTPIQEDCASADLTSKNREIVFPAKINVYFVSYVLVIPDANIR
jgi:hypothetical protein